MRKFNLILILALFFSSLVFAQDLEPRRIAKTGDVEIPEGMHIVRDRTGARWLLPLDMDVVPESTVKPAEYYKAKVEPTIIGNIRGQQIYNGPKSGKDVFVNKVDFWGKIPAKFAKLLESEKDLNLHGQTDHFSFLGDFGPASKVPFMVPYIPIPESEFPFAYVSEFASDDSKQFIRTKDNRGRTIIRAFIHPNFPDNFSELIEKYGLVYHYVGVTTSSPRSLIVIDPNEPEKIHWVKPSLPKKIDGSVRLNIDTKLRRAVIMSEALASIPQASRAAYGVDFMIEPGSVQFPGKNFGTIFRELHPELVNPKPGTSWLPAFALNAPQANGKIVLEEMIEKSGKPAQQFIVESIVRPFLRAYLSLALMEGLPGEFHTQNFYYGLNSRGLPFGRFLFKDNDGFRFDVEIAARKKRNLSYLSKFKKPFFWAKFSNALGTGGEGIQFLGSWYYKLIRNVNGFETLSSYILSVMQKLEPSNPLWTKDGIQRIFDDIALEEAQKMTGVSIPADKKYGFAKDKGLNEVLNLHRKNLAENDFQDKWKTDDNLQNLLRKAYGELKELEATHERGSVSGRTYFVGHVMADGTIVLEGRSPNPGNEYKNPTMALAIVEPGSDVYNKISEPIANKLLQCR